VIDCISYLGVMYDKELLFVCHINKSVFLVHFVILLAASKYSCYWQSKSNMTAIAGQ